MSTTAEMVVKPFPFDLDNLFNLQYSFDSLKKAIEYLASEQMTLKSQMREQQNKQSTSDN